MINALNSGARVFMADFEDALSPDLGERRRRPGDADRRGPPARSTFDSPDGKAYRLNERDRDAGGPAARLAPGRVARAGRRRARSRRSLFDFGLYLFHNAAERCARGSRPVLLPAQARVPPRGPAVERRVRPRPGGARASRAARSGRRSSSRRSSPPSRWTRSCTSCASTPPASTPAAGTTSSA